MNSKDALAVVPPGGTISGSVPIRLGNCYNPDCDHMLGSSSHAIGSSGNRIIMSEPKLDPECAYCGWTIDGAPKDAKWLRKRWPERYAEMRARHFERQSVPARSYWQRIFGPPPCVHDWVKTQAEWHEDIKELYWSHYRYQKATKCTGVICDKCGARSIKRSSQGEIGTMHGLEGKPYYWYMAKNTQGPLNFEWPELPPYHFRDIPELINGQPRTYEDAFKDQIAKMEAGSGYVTRKFPCS